MGTDNKDVESHMICPDCNNSCDSADGIYIVGTDELEFSWNGTGHWAVDCHCNKCKKYFRTYIDFNYIVTRSSVR